MTLWAAALLALALILGLFAFAAYVEARQRWLDQRVRLRHYAYTLALGVYCTSWTFYGAVGSAVREGWNYLPIYAAPMLVLIAAPRFLARLTQAVADEQATTVSDFIAARFGHDVVVARLVTIIALMGSIPYVALQLRSIGAPPGKPGQDRVRAAAAVPLRVLVVDNEQRIVEASQILLEGLGHRVMVATDSAGCLAQCSLADILFADYQLDHDEDGLTLIEQARVLHPGLPAVLVTAESGRDMFERAARLGVKVLAKPVNPQAFMQILSQSSMLEVEP